MLRFEKKYGFKKYGFKKGDRISVIHDCTINSEYECEVPFDQTGMIGTVVGEGSLRLPILIELDEEYRQEGDERIRRYHLPECIELEHKGFDPEDIISKATGGS